MANLSPRFLFSNGVVSQPANTPPITSFLATHPPREIKRSNCFYKNGGTTPCHVNSNPYYDGFWHGKLSSLIFQTFSYEIGSIKGSMTWICIGTVTQIQKICRSFQALGDKPFAYSYSLKLRAGAFLALGYEYHYY
ncbi:hypothetical protein PRUPE_I002700 [Prunus persica]|uniref:Uncharacterized protein n=1 Tax=Prunus persica TaxID=3760 RepID=A0A1R3L529_PRUPE|nr:hypothetical protein PRUPE_I002700 [Prunus persica]